MPASEGPTPGTALGDFESSDAKLRRTIGLWTLIAIAVTCQLGSGWLLAVLAAAGVAGPASLISWVLGALFFGVMAIPWMETGTMLPRSGGGVRYPHLSHGAFLGWFNGWAYLVAAVTLPPIEVQAALTYVGGRFPGLGLLREQAGVTMLAWPNGILVGLVLIFGFFLLNIFGVRLLTEASNWATVWKLVVPAVTFILLFTAFKSTNFSSMGGFAPLGPISVFHAVSSGGIVFAFNGVRQIMDFGGETRRPQRDIPIAMMVGGLLIPLIVYIVLQTAFIGVIDWHAAGIHAGDWAGLINSKWASAPLFEALAVSGFAAFGTVLLIDAAISPAATGWVWVGISARTAYATSVNGSVPRLFQRMNRFGVPWVSMIACAVVSCVFFLPTPSWYQMVGMVSTALVLSYLLGGPILTIMRRTAGSLHRPVRIRAARFWAPFAHVATLLVVYFAGWSTLINLMTVVFLGLPLYTAYISPKYGWSRRAPGLALSVVFLAAWAVVGWGGGWLMTVGGQQRPGGWGFPPFYGAYCLVVLGYVAGSWLLSDREGRRHVAAGVWIIVTLLVTMLVAYLSEFGPLTRPVIPSGIDLLITAAVGLGSYYWAVASGFGTDQLKEIVTRQAVLDDGEDAHGAAVRTTAASTPGAAEGE